MQNNKEKFLLAATTTGSLGEYITAAVILSLGWKVVLAPQDYVDLVAFNNNTFLRIHVKTAWPNPELSGNYKSQNGSGSKKKLLTPEKYDILAHCAADKRRCHFYASSSVNQLTKRYRSQHFDDPTLELESWIKAVEFVKNSRG